MNPLLANPAYLLAVEAGEAPSLEKLISQAYRLRLLADYRMTPLHVHMQTGEEIVILDPEEARLYLHGLVLGYALGPASIRLFAQA